MSLEENVSPVIPSSMRPSKSLLGQVKSTLSDLVSSVFKKSVIARKEKELIETEDNCKDSKDGDHENTGVVKSENGISSKKANSPHGKSQTLRSREAFNRRLKSFTLPLWCGKPLNLSPPLLSQYGWECCGENMARCCICATVISVHLPWPNSSNYHTICKESQEKIIKGHKKVCSWPNNPVSDTYLNPYTEMYLTPEDRVKLKQDFIDRAKRLYDLQKHLPHVTPDILEEMKLNEWALTKLLRLVDLNNSASLENDEMKRIDHAMQVSSVSLSLCGWDTESNKRLFSVYCSDTGRTVGLWNFHSVSSDGDSLPAKRRKLNEGDNSLKIEKSWFHPISQHRMWSPWIVTLRPTTSLLVDPSLPPTDPNTKPGWLVLRDVLLEAVDVTQSSPTASSSQSVRSPPREAVLKARRMIEEWSSP